MENKDNILDYVPVQNCPWDKDEKGKVYLIKEKTKSKLLKKIIGWLGRSQDFHIHLDELGTAAWLQADGQRTILEISAILRQARRRRSSRPRHGWPIFSPCWPGTFRTLEKRVTSIRGRNKKIINS